MGGAAVAIGAILFNEACRYLRSSEGRAMIYLGTHMLKEELGKLNRRAQSRHKGA